MPLSCDYGASIFSAQYISTPPINAAQVPEQEHEKSARVFRALRWLLCIFTIYPQLTETSSPVDDARKTVHDRLQKEWIYCGGMVSVVSLLSTKCNILTSLSARSNRQVFISLS